MRSIFSVAIAFISLYGPVGAMDDEDAAHIQALVLHAQCRQIAANHVIHVVEPEKFVREVEAFSA